MEKTASSFPRWRGSKKRYNVVADTRSVSATPFCVCLSKPYALAQSGPRLSKLFGQGRTHSLSEGGAARRWLFKGFLLFLQGRIWEIRIQIMYTFPFSRNAIIWKRCASTFRGGHAHFQLRAAFPGRLLAVLRFSFQNPHITMTQHIRGKHQGKSCVEKHVNI